MKDEKDHHQLIGPKDITELSVTVAGMMIWASGLADNKEAGMVMAKGCSRKR